MNAYIHYLFGEPWNVDCAAAEKGFTALGIKCVPFSNNETLDKAQREDIVIGGLLTTHHALANRNATPPTIDYPQSLKAYLGRSIDIRTCEHISLSDLPLFIKPVKEKLFPACIVYTNDELKSLPKKQLLYCSNVESFSSEWRLFIRYNKAVGLCHYAGNPQISPSTKVLERIIKEYRDAPAGCAVDLGITKKGETLLVEVNDGYALGAYGLNPQTYALLLYARWAELLKIDDLFKDEQCLV